MSLLTILLETASVWRDNENKKINGQYTLSNIESNQWWSDDMNNVSRVFIDFVHARNMAIDKWFQLLVAGEYYKYVAWLMRTSHNTTYSTSNTKLLMSLMIIAVQFYISVHCGMLVWWTCFRNEQK